MFITRSLKTWRTARQTAYELRRLSNRELDDLGINRTEIDSIALKAARSGAI